jgi:hypothetical protein
LTGFCVVRPPQAPRRARKVSAWPTCPLSRDPEILVQGIAFSNARTSGVLFACSLILTSHRRVLCFLDRPTKTTTGCGTILWLTSIGNGQQKWSWQLARATHLTHRLHTHAHTGSRADRTSNHRRACRPRASVALPFLVPGAPSFAIRGVWGPLDSSVRDFCVPAILSVRMHV